MLTNIYNYSGVLFTHKDVNSLDSFTKLLGNENVSEPEVVASNNEIKAQLVLFKYWSTSQFSKNPELEKIWTDRGYEYQFYYLSLWIDDQYYSVIAVPWFKMGVELLGRFKPKSLSRDSEIKYYQLELSGLIKSLKSNMDENITLLSSHILVESESNVATLNISGQNPLHSQLFNEIDELVDYKPSKCKIIYKQEGSGSIRVSFDNYGSFQFRIGSDLTQVLKLINIFYSLNERELLKKIEGYYNPMKLRLRIKEDDSERELGIM